MRSGGRERTIPVFVMYSVAEAVTGGSWEIRGCLMAGPSEGFNTAAAAAYCRREEAFCESEMLFWKQSEQTRGWREDPAHSISFRFLHLLEIY